MSNPVPGEKSIAPPPSAGTELLVALAGLACVVLPPHILPGAMDNPPYGQPLVPWFASALANPRFVPTLVALAVLGVYLGLAQPRWWPLSCCLTASLPLLLDIINISHDWSTDPTSHNLLPFEIAMIAAIAVPALVGGVIGSVIRSQLRRRPGVS